jgi:hypothetical protein
MMKNNLKKKVIQGIALGTIGLILVIFFSLFSSQSPNEDRYKNQPLFSVRNTDENQSHTVMISVISSDNRQFEAIYNLTPKQIVFSTVNTGKTSQDYDFYFTIDDKPSSHIRLQIAPRVTTYFDVTYLEGNSSVSVVDFIS